MGGLIAFEGWELLQSTSECVDELINIAHCMVPSACDVRLAVAGSNSERKIELSQASDVIEAIAKSWTITALDKKTRTINNGLISSKSFFIIKMHKSMRGIYIYSESFDQSFDKISELLNPVLQMLPSRIGGFGYYESFSDPVDATIYALDLKVLSNSKNIENSLELPKNEWKNNFARSIKERLPRNFYMWNLLPAEYLDRFSGNRDFDILSRNKSVHINRLCSYDVVSFTERVDLDLVRQRLHHYIIE